MKPQDSAASPAPVAALPGGDYIAVRGVHKSYAGHGLTTHALAGVELSVERGSFVSIVGPSGCGKSTLLQIMAGLVSATRGEVLMKSALAPKSTLALSNFMVLRATILGSYRVACSNEWQ